MTMQPLMMAEGMLCLTTVSPWQQGREFIIDRAVSGSHFLRCCISREKLKMLTIHSCNMRGNQSSSVQLHCHSPRRDW